MKKCLFLLIIIVAQWQTGRAEKRGQERIDSLMVDLQNVTTDTQKAKVLIDLSFTYNTIDPEAGIRYGLEGLELAQKVRSNKDQIDVYRALGVNFGFGKSEFPEALSWFSKSLALAEKTGDKSNAAKALNNMGVIYWYLSDFPKAVEHYFKAMQIHEQLANKVEVAIALANIGIVYNSQGDYAKALEYLLKGNAIDEELGNKVGVAANLGNIGEVYNRLNDLPKALYYDSCALALNEQLGDKNGVTRNLSNIGSIYAETGQYALAMEHFTKAITLSREIDLRIGIGANQGTIGQTILKMVKENRTKELHDILGWNKTQALRQAEILMDSSIAVYNEIGDLHSLLKVYEYMSEIKSMQGDQAGALASYKQSVVLKDSVFNMEKNNKLTEAAMQYDFDKKEAAAKAEQVQKDMRSRLVRNCIGGSLILALGFLGVVYRQRNRIRKEMDITETEKKRSESLLLNILPGEVAEELKETGSAKAKSFEEVTVMLTDFKGFTQISQKIPAESLVAEIHYCFSAFDRIIQKYKIEKIKTIGDAYLCVSGLPISNDTHAQDILNAAIEIRDFMAHRKLEKEAKGEIPFEIRIGIHTGPVVAGIVGLNKFQYDIWGDTVNTTSRMETCGEAGKINISEATYLTLKDTPGLNFTYRGMMEAKGKGEVKMYFVENRELKELVAPRIITEKPSLLRPRFMETVVYEPVVA